MQNIAILFKQASLASQAQQISQKLKLPLVEHELTGYSAYLSVEEEGLKLQLADSKMKAIWVDFCGGALAYRCQHGGGKSQLIAKAIGLNKKSKLSVLDLTAGLGRDAYVLAHLGCSVTMVERSPIMAALLEDGLKRAELNANSTVQHLKLIHQDSLHFLQQHTKLSEFEVVYLDPMFSTEAKSALVKKEMRILREIVGNDLDADQLLQQALSLAPKRVVVKRARHAPSLKCSSSPTYQLLAQSTRFDIYCAK